MGLHKNATLQTQSFKCKITQSNIYVVNFPLLCHHLQARYLQCLRVSILFLVNMRQKLLIQHLEILYMIYTVLVHHTSLSKIELRSCIRTMLQIYYRVSIVKLQRRSNGKLRSLKERDNNTYGKTPLLTHKNE